MRFLLFFLLLLSLTLTAQEKGGYLRIGTNLTGINDYGTELPFKNMMLLCRQWLTQNRYWVDDGPNDWNSGYIDRIPLDSCGYPLSMPAHFPEAPAPQILHNIWAYINHWPAGEYVLLYDGKGRITSWGEMELTSEAPNRLTFNFNPQPLLNYGQSFSILIDSSDASDPVRNIRLLIPGTEFDYEDQPFNPKFLERIAPFSVLRFMDWGSTNGWDESIETYTDTTRRPWSIRSKPYYYTYAVPRGVPYEYMIKLCNITKKDMWICVPHNASDEYIRNMAKLVKETLDPDLKVYVEYSNEIWNWSFWQTTWLNQNFCIDKGISWPEGIVPLVQNCLDIWSDVFKDEMSRVVRVVGAMAGWFDVSQRIVMNMRPGSFDAFSPAAYFSFYGYESALDSLGENATPADIAAFSRKSREVNEMHWLRVHREEIADSIGVEMIFYEGGQHFTPDPYGQDPSYVKALTDIHRDSSMYNLYTEWLGFLETLQPKDKPGLLMNYSSVSALSPSYGSWGMLESVYQDTNVIPAPKYQAYLDYIKRTTSVMDNQKESVADFRLKGNYPNPFNPSTTIAFEIPGGIRDNITLKVYDILGREIAQLINETLQEGKYKSVFDPSKYGCSSGVYFCRLTGGGKSLAHKMIFLK